MAFLMLHATAKDISLLRDWINESEDVAWITKVAQSGNKYAWKAAQKIPTIEEQLYAIWHISSGPLNIPSGQSNVPDVLVRDPFEGWTHTLESQTATAPWFGSNLPGPYVFQFRENGREQAGSLGRSDFYWAQDRYRAIGKPAHPDAKRWWNSLKRFIDRSSTKVPWPDPAGRLSAHVFPDALAQQRSGRHLDVNP